MRHGNNKRKFGRVRKVRKALINTLALNLIVRGKIKTTEPKAKEIRPFVEKLITGAKRGDMATRRLIIAKLFNRSREVKKLFDVIAPKYKERKGGYTRIIKLGSRKSDGAAMAVIEFI
jgi:large subunit ribosomal protein L17